MRKVRAKGVARPDAAQRVGGRLGGQPAGQPGGDELDQQRVQPVDQLGSGADQIVAVLGHRPQRGDRLVDLDGAQRGR